jgi:hypothetical protein
MNYSMRFRRFIIGTGASALLFATLVAQGQPVAITEFVASNDHGLIDGEGNASDWIELYNGGPGLVSLDGWCLTDDRADPLGPPRP